MKLDWTQIWKWTAIGLMVVVASHTIYHFRDFRREVALAQRDDLAQVVVGLTQKSTNTDLVTQINEILKTNGRPDLQREVPQKQVAAKEKDARAEVPD